MKRSVKKLPLAKASATLADAAESLNGVALVLTVKGKPVAALVPVEGVDWESLMVGTSPDFLDLIERSRREYEQHGGISSEQVRRELGLPPFNPADALPAPNGPSRACNRAPRPKVKAKK